MFDHDRLQSRVTPSWTDQSESALKDCFDHADRDIFRVASENSFDLYAYSGSEFIRKCIGDVVPTVTVKTYLNEKPSIDGGIRSKLKARTTAFDWEYGRM